MQSSETWTNSQGMWMYKVESLNGPFSFCNLKESCNIVVFENQIAIASCPQKPQQARRILLSLVSTTIGVWCQTTILSQLKKTLRGFFLVLEILNNSAGMMPNRPTQHNAKIESGGTSNTGGKPKISWHQIAWAASCVCRQLHGP